MQKIFKQLAFFSAKFGLILLLLVAFVSRAVGDSNVPKAPFVGQAPNPSAWVVTFTYDSAQEKNPDSGISLKEMRVSRVGQRRREVSLWSDGTETEDWHLGNVLIVRQHNWPPDLILARISGQPDDDFLLGWVNATYFKNKEDRQGHSCFLYEALDTVINPAQGVTPEMEARSNDPSIPEENRKFIKAQMEQMRKNADKKTQVWIDSKTLLPVEIDGGGVRKQFEFSTKPIANLELPPSYQRQYDQLKKMYPNAVGDVP